MGDLQAILESVNFRPKGDRILVRPPRQMDKIGKIIIPTTAKQELPTYGVIVSIGPGLKDRDGVLEPVDLKVDEVVWFGKHAGYKIQVEDEEFLILRELDVFGTSVIIND